MSDSEQEAWQQQEFDDMKAQVAQLQARVEELEAENKRLWSELHKAQRVYRQMKAEAQGSDTDE